MKLSAPKINNNQKGFTLIELLVVIGILAVLMGIVLVAINPSRQFKQANDAKRNNDVRQILNAVGNYIADNKGVIPTQIATGSAQPIGSGVGNSDLCALLVPTYISALPQDPNSNSGAAITVCTGYNSQYNITQDTSGRVTVSAPNAAFGAISVTR